MKIKNILYGILTSILIFSNSCDIEENPSFFAGDTMFADVQGANTVLNSVYAYIGNFKTWSGVYPQIITGSSGLFGMGNKSYSTIIGNFSPYASFALIQRHWIGCYTTIGRANDLIAGLSEVQLDDTAEQDNILGQAYFIRAWMYFNMVRIWGGVPLVVGRVSPANVNLPRASVDEMYAQIIDDATKAEEMLKEIAQQEAGRPGKQAASMLLAKIYMTLAGNQTASETDNWQKAWDEAIKVYQAYSLVPDYRSLWYAETGNNTSESIFELQGNEEQTMSMGTDLFCRKQ